MTPVVHSSFVQLYPAPHATEAATIPPTAPAASAAAVSPATRPAVMGGTSGLPAPPADVMTNPEPGVVSNATSDGWVTGATLAATSAACARRHGQSSAVGAACATVATITTSAVCVQIRSIRAARTRAVSGL